MNNSPVPSVPAPSDATLAPRHDLLEDAVRLGNAANKLVYWANLAMDMARGEGIAATKEQAALLVRELKGCLNLCEERTVTVTVLLEEI